jgi:hypothetical protein
VALDNGYGVRYSSNWDEGRDNLGYGVRNPLLTEYDNPMICYKQDQWRGMMDPNQNMDMQRMEDNINMEG